MAVNRDARISYSVMKRWITIAIIVLTGMSLTMSAQSTKRKNVKGSKYPAAVETTSEAQNDTINSADELSGLVEIKNFKKAVASRVETVMITNRSASDTLRSVSVDIDYRTPEGEQLNRRAVTFKVDVPPGETRHASVPSWDRQQLFYHVDTPPVRKTQRTAPFTVTLVFLNAVVTKGN